LNENTFFLYSQPPPPPNNVANRFVDVYLFPTLKKGEGEEEGLAFCTKELH